VHAIVTGNLVHESRHNLFSKINIKPVIVLQTDFGSNGLYLIEGSLFLSTVHSRTLYRLGIQHKFVFTRIHKTTSMTSEYPIHTIACSLEPIVVLVNLDKARWTATLVFMIMIPTLVVLHIRTVISASYISKRNTSMSSINV
jgi:hypothetical protein